MTPTEIISVSISLLTSLTLFATVALNYRKNQVKAQSVQRSDLAEDYERVKGQRDECRETVHQLYTLSDSLKIAAEEFRLQAEAWRQQSLVFQERLKDLQEKIARLDLELLTRRNDDGDVVVNVSTGDSNGVAIKHSSVNTNDMVGGDVVKRDETRKG